LPLCSALNIQLNSPEEVTMDEEFSVTISADTTEIHDVKVFVHNSEDDKIDRNEYISEIHDGEWKDSYLYIKGSFPEDNEYKIKILESPGEREICARLRKTGTSSFSTQCNKIKILSSKNSEEENNKDDEKKSEDDSEDKPEDKDTIEATKSKELSSVSEETSNIQQLPNKQEKIMLNSKSSTEEKFENSRSITTPEGNKRKFLIYGFTGFCVLIIILLAMRKL
jgi:hypothetical protein